MTISNEAVEAAARSLNDAFPQMWEKMPEWAREEERKTARAALEAAAPHIAAQAKAEALREAADLIEPFSGIGLANGATRGDVSRWLRARAAMYRNEV